MGCDIHLHVEIKVRGKWLHYNHPKIPRNYQLFGKMAGVRDHDETPIAAPRGIPKDASETTILDWDYEHGDAHTPSWLGAWELTKLKDWADDVKALGDDPWSFDDALGYLFGNSVAEFEKQGDGYPPELEDVRVVFWFDN